VGFRGYPLASSSASNVQETEDNVNQETRVALGPLPRAVCAGLGVPVS